MRFAAFLVSVGIGLSASGCVTSSAQKTTRFDKTVIAGSEIDIGPYHSLSPDCANRGRARLLLMNAPAKGQFIAREKMDYSSFDANNPRSACNKRLTPSINAIYRASPGATGSDYFSYDVIWNDGTMWRAEVYVTIR